MTTTLTTITLCDICETAPAEGILTHTDRDGVDTANTCADCAGNLERSGSSYHFTLTRPGVVVGYVVIEHHPWLGARIYDASDLGDTRSREACQVHADALNALPHTEPRGLRYTVGVVTTH